MNDCLHKLSVYFILNSVMCCWSFFHLSQMFSDSVGHVYVGGADRCHLIYDQSEHYIMG